MEFDGELINALRDNGRLSVSELSRRLGTPRRRVQERLTDLLDSGSMRIVANVHPGLLGIHTFCDVLLWVDGPTLSVTEALRSIPEATLISAVAGNCDVVVELGAADYEHLGALLRQVREIPGVREAASSQLVHVFKSRFGVGSELSEFALPAPDIVDSQIIALLRKDGRMPYLEIGQQVGLSIGAVRARFARLTQTGMLRIACELSRADTARPAKMGAGIRLRGNEDQVVDALHALPSVEFGAVAIGNFDIVLTISAASTRALRVAVDEIRELSSISSIATWVHLDLVRESYE